MKNNVIFVLNDYVEDVINNIEDYEYSEIFQVAMNYELYQKKLLDYLLLDTCYTNVANKFRENLEYVDKYDEYVMAVLDGNDEILKSYIIIYFENELLGLIQNNIEELIENLFKSNYPAKYKVNLAAQYAKFVTKDEYIYLIANNIKYLIMSDEEYRNLYTIDELKELIAYYMTIVNNNYNSEKTPLIEYRYVI